MPELSPTELVADVEARLRPLELELEGEVTNVFDEQVALQVDDRLILGRAIDNFNPPPRVPPPVAQGGNANFGRPTDLSPPRAIILSAIVRY